MSRLPSVRPLPARVVPQPGESLASLLQRGGELMGYENAKRMQWLLKGSGPWSGNPNHFSHESLLARVGQLLLCSPQRLFQMTVHRYAAALVLVPPDAPSPTRCDGNTIVRYFFPAARPVCIRCLTEDPAPYERLAWRFRPLLACLRHRCALVMRCPVCRRSLRREGRLLARCRCGACVEDRDVFDLPPPVSNSLQRLSGWIEAATSPTPQMSLPACLWWAHRLSVEIGKTPAWIEKVSEAWSLPAGIPPELLHWAVAAELLEHWPERFLRFLEMFQSVPENATTSTGTSRAFGHLLTRAAELEEFGYASPAEVLRGYLLERFTFKRAVHKSRLFRNPQGLARLPERRWVSWTEAAQVLRTSPGAIANLVCRGVLEGQHGPADTCGQSAEVLSRSSLVHLIRSLDESFD